MNDYQSATSGPLTQSTFRETVANNSLFQEGYQQAIQDVLAIRREHLDDRNNYRFSVAMQKETEMWAEIAALKPKE
jgi:hypothetical protein